MKAAGSASAPSFLARIVGRAHGDASAVAPRLPGLFEPAHARQPLAEAMHADGDAGDAKIDLQVARAHFAADRAPSPHHPPHEANDTTPSRRARKRSAENHDVAAERTPVALGPRRPPRSMPLREPAPRTEIVPPPLLDSRPRAPVGAPPVETRATNPSDGTSRRNVASGDADETTAQRTRVAPSIPPSDESLAQSVLVPRQVAFETPRALVRADGERRSTESAPARPEPAVHISIGRIEVRASPPPATAVRASRTQRPMSLDEYLGGKERAR